MSDQIKHECGLAVIRLLKPLDFYLEKYGTALYGLNKLQLMMQKQRNRGQDGAGIATIKLDMHPGTRYISRKRSIGSSYLKDLFEDVYANFTDLTQDQMEDIDWLKVNKPYTGEVLMGHLRYGTHGGNSIESVHPFLRQNNWISRNLVCAGNFNMTNIEELFEELLSFGQYPKEVSDTVTVMEKIGHFLDDEVQRIFDIYKQEGYSNVAINKFIIDQLDVQRILTRACRKFDGGYVIGGLIGHGDAFVLRDPAGIRPAFYYVDDEVAVVASERPPIQTCFDVRHHQIREIKPGHALIMRKNGFVEEVQVKEELPRKSCSFERIYFSKGTDRDIYLERKQLGANVVPQILKSINYDFENTIFSFIPNTAEVAFFGMLEGLDAACNELKKRRLLELGPNATPEAIDRILAMRPRSEKLAIKDEKLRTFIADDGVRSEMVAHVYDVTYGIVRNELDTLVLIDDSIVRGTTLRDSIIYILAHLKPKKIIIVSSAPQIRYPDCYGIDMSKMKDFVAFKALLELLKRDNREELLQEVYERCKLEELKPVEDMVNHVKSLYDLYSDEDISEKVAQIVRAEHIRPEVEIIYQTIENLHQACPNHLGDWYFSGDYPTVGGVRVVNRAFINFMENKNTRAYA
ncbi:MAG TPA: amidophosphoribosyltransferase [Saprospiraceae bacterium]|nr:amidophosphoribosyltransferase [Saprospiraceae bacterium]HPN68814.1 amidophosphoribosyltransferase [Saprospiraceae bacterium]